MRTAGLYRVHVKFPDAVTGRGENLYLTSFNHLKQVSPHNAIQTHSDVLAMLSCLNCTGSSGGVNGNIELPLASQRQCKFQSQPINIFTAQRPTHSEMQNQHKPIDRQNIKSTS